MNNDTKKRLHEMFHEEEALMDRQISAIIDEIESGELDSTTLEDRFAWLSNLFSDLVVIRQKHDLILKVPDKQPPDAAGSEQAE